MEGNEENWKGRCKVLEGQLDRFKEQASKVREVIGQKVQGLEQKALRSEAKAIKASCELKVLEETVSVKDEAIEKLASELETERQLRIQHEQQVEGKAAHIKEWMQKKISEFEAETAKSNEENEHLKKENTQLKISYRQANDVVNELEVKLRYSQEQVFRLSEELYEIEESKHEYHILEPPEQEPNKDSSKQELYPSEIVVKVSLNSNHPVSPTLLSYSTADSQPGATPQSITSPDSPTSLELPESPMSTTADGHDDNTNDDNCHSSGTYCACNDTNSKELLPEEINSVHDPENDSNYTAIKRSSSGKSPSKIPRYVGQSGTKADQQSSAGKVSYYMSLKRGKDGADGNKAKFYIQVRDIENPYMQLMEPNQGFGSNTTVDYERDSIVDTYCSPLDTKNTCMDPPSADMKVPHGNVLDSVTSLNSNDTLTLDVHDLYRSIVRPLKPVEKTSDNRVGPLSPISPPPPSPHQHNTDDLMPPSIPLVPSAKEGEGDVVRREGQFTSYLPQGELHKENGILEDMSPSPPSWLLNDSLSSLETDSPPYATLESITRDINSMLKEQTCPVYATLKGRASQLRDTPFSGESTDSSDHEDDYCFPPDENDDSDDNVDSTDEKNQRVLKTCATYTTVNLKKEDQRKEGYLTKLGGRIKNWRKRWFVLQDGKLYYYKTPNETHRKPLGQVPLDGSCRISRTEGKLTIEVATPDRTYYLTGETSEVVDEWLRVLHNVMRKFSSSPLLAQMPHKEVMSGWVTKVKHGSSKRSWCVLRGQYLCYYKNADDAVPYSMANLMDIVVEQVETPDSEDDLDSDSPSYRHFTLVLKGYKNTIPTYLLIDTKAEKDLWLFHLTVSSGTGLGNMGTDFEKLVAKLVSMDGDPGSALWNTPLLTFSKEPITSPLTTLPSVELEKEALELFKSILLFTTVATNETAIDYHVSLAQNALQLVLDHPELQNEIYCQLIKQTSKLIHRGPQDLGHYLMNCGKRSWLRGDSFALEETIDLRPMQEFVYLQTWQLLALCTSLFVPKQQFLSYVKAHVRRSCDLKTKQGKYATYCLRSLERTITNGKREARPSRMEVLSVLLQNPCDHSCRMSLPVQFVDGKCHVFALDGSTTVEEFTETMNMALGIRESSQSGYAIFTDNPVSPVEHCLQKSVKLCDVMSKWEQAMRSNQGRLDSKRMIKLTYKNRLYFKSLQEKEPEKEKYFVVFQTNVNVVKGRFPVSREMAIELAALMAQIQYGDYRAHSNSLPSKRIEVVISRNFPKSLREGGDNDSRSLTLKMAEKWSVFHGWNSHECVDKYLENARRWPFFGCRLFKAKQKDTASSIKKRASSSVNTQPVWLAVEEDSINILEGESLRLMCRYKYKHVVTFGGCKDDFMLVVNQSIMRGGNTVEQGTQRLLFNMSRGKILEITLLMASYINAIVRQQGITCDVPPKKGPSGGPQVELKVWDLESAEWPIIPGSNVSRLV